MKIRLSLMVVPLVVATAGLAACGSGTGSSGNTYVLGAALPLSGPAASFGNAYKDGIEACVSYLNDTGDLAKDVEVKYVDTGGGETAKGISAFTKLTTVDHASTVFSAYSSITTALAPLAERKRVPVMNGGALSPSLANQSYVWNTVAFISSELAASVPYVIEQSPEYKEATLIYQDDVVGKDAIDIVSESWEGDGRTLDTLAVGVKMSSFTAQADKIKSQDPDVIFMVYSGDTQAVLIQQLRRAGVTAQIVGGSPFPVPAVLELEEADGSLFTLQSIDFAAKDELTKAFLKRTGSKPGAGDIVAQANYCNGALMWARAVKEPEDAGEDVTGENLNAEFEKQGSIDAVGGKLELLDDHTLKPDIAINQLENGSFSTLTTITADD